MTKEEEWSISYLQRRNADLEAENETLRRRLNEFSIVRRIKEIDHEHQSIAQ